MKRIGLVLLLVGVLIMSVGLGFSFLTSIAVCGEPCIKSRLDSVLKAKGYAVMWDNGKYEYIPLYFREQLERVDRGEAGSVPREQMVQKFQQAGLIHFMEVEAGIYFFFLEKPFFLSNSQSGFLHIHNRTFQVLVLGKLILSEEEIENSFPFEEVKGIATWQNETGRNVQRYTTLVGIVFLLCGGGSIAVFRALLFFRKQPQAVGMEIVLPATGQERVKKVGIIPPPERPQSAKEDIGALRLRVISALDNLIETHDGELQEYFQSMRLEAQGEQRITRLSYTLTHRIPSILEQNLDIDLIEEGSIDALPPRSEIGEKEMEVPPSPEKQDQWLKNLLPIDDLLPEGLDPSCIRKILWVLLKDHLFGDKFRHYQFVRGSVSWKGVPPEQWETSFEWLVKRDVILHRKRHGGRDFVCSLNPDLGSTQSPGREIIRAVVRARQLLVLAKR